MFNIDAKIWHGRNSTIISSQLRLQINTLKVLKILLVLILAIASLYACIINYGKPKNNACKTIFQLL